MNITEVRVKLMHDRTDRLRAFCSVTIDDDFVVHDLRVIEGRKGMFVAMPSRKLRDNCPRCGSKNELRASYCSSCGGELAEGRGAAAGGPDRYHVDVAHPINTACRETLQTTVLAAYEEEARRAREGLEPLHEYTGAGLEELAEEYEEEEEGAEAEVEEPEPAPEPPEPEPEPALEADEEELLTYAHALADEEAGEPELISAWDEEEAEEQEVELEPAPAELAEQEEDDELISDWEEVEIEEEEEQAPKPAALREEEPEPAEAEAEEEGKAPGAAGKGPKRSLRERDTGGFGEGIL